MGLMVKPTEKRSGGCINMGEIYIYFVQAGKQALTNEQKGLRTQSIIN